MSAATVLRAASMPAAANGPTALPGAGDDSSLGTERKIVINTNDGLTGLPPGDARFARTKTIHVRVDEQSKDGRTRRVVTELKKNTVVVTGAWSS